MKKKKYSIIVGQMHGTDCMWIEYHSCYTNTIYVNIIHDKNDIDKLKVLNIQTGSRSSFDSVGELIKLAIKNAMILPISQVEIISKMRERLCICYNDFSYIDYINTKD